MYYSKWTLMHGHHLYTYLCFPFREIKINQRIKVVHFHVMITYGLLCQYIAYPGEVFQFRWPAIWLRQLVVLQYLHNPHRQLNQISVYHEMRVFKSQGPNKTNTELGNEFCICFVFIVSITGNISSYHCVALYKRFTHEQYYACIGISAQ